MYGFRYEGFGLASKFQVFTNVPQDYSAVKIKLKDRPDRKVDDLSRPIITQDHVELKEMKRRLKTVTGRKKNTIHSFNRRET